MKKIMIGLTFIWVLAGLNTSYAEEAYRVSAMKGPYFLCDDRVVEDRWLLERFSPTLKKHADHPLIVKDHEWEGSGPLMGGSVLYDPEEGLYKIWYCVWNSHQYYNKLPFSYNMCYAESKDGLKWTKPALGVFKHDADPDNNFIHCGQDKTQNMDVMLNPRPDLYPGKFLAIHNQKGGVFVSYSEDGKSFTFLQDESAIQYHSDTLNNFVYDEVRDTWRIFCRPRAYAGDHKRRVSMQESGDLRSWTHERTILVPTETEKQEYYGMTVFRRGDLFFGLLRIYDRETGFMHPEIAWSGDGEHWNQIATHPPLLERGDVGAWDHGMVMPAESPVVVGDQMRFYYGGFAKDHNSHPNPAAIGMATAGRDRLVGLRPSTGEPGFVLTRPMLVSEGMALVVNAQIDGQGGVIRAELRDDNNRPLPGFTLEESDPITRSGYAQGVTWAGRDIGSAPLKEVRIRFELTNAQLFTFDLTTSITNPFFAFDNGVGRGEWTPEYQAETLAQLGYAGIGYTGTTELGVRLENFEQRNLQIFSLYVPCNFNEMPTFGDDLKAGIKQLKGKDVILWLTVQGKAETDEKAVQVVAEIADFAAASGLKVALYPHAGFFVADIEDALRISKQVKRPNLGVSFNLCHELKAGNEARFDALLEEAMPQLFLVSINGADHEGDWDKLIQPLGKGPFDLNRVLHKLKALDYKGPIGLQCYNVPGDTLGNLEHNIKQWQSIIRP
jgi:sugar phosphate isomerase/epimerase